MPNGECRMPNGCAAGGRKGGRVVVRHLLFRSLAILLFGASSLRSALCVAADEGVEVPAEIAGKVVFVKGTVNERGPMTLILDTGATETVLTPQAAEKADIRSPGPASQAIKKGLARSVEVGEAKVANLTLHVFDPPQALSLRLDKGINYHGILGYTFLSRFVTTIDYRRQKVRFESTASARREDERAAVAAGRQVVPVQVKDGLIFVQADLNGKYRATFLLDTGSAEALLMPQAIPELEDQAKPLPGYEGVKQLTIETVAMGEAKVSKVPFIIHAPPQERQARPGYHGILGYPFLSHFVVTVNYRDKQLVLTPAEPVNGAPKGKPPTPQR